MYLRRRFEDLIYEVEEQKGRDYRHCSHRLCNNHGAMAQNRQDLVRLLAVMLELGEGVIPGSAAHLLLRVALEGHFVRGP